MKNEKVNSETLNELFSLCHQFASNSSDRLKLNQLKEYVDDNISETDEERIFYTIEITQILVSQLDKDIKTINACILIGLFEDKILSFQKLVDTLDSDVAEIVIGYNKYWSISSKAIVESKYEFRLLLKLLLTISSDVRIFYVILAVVLHKKERINELDEKENLKFANQLIYVYEPLTSFLNLTNVFKELDDSGSLILYPEVYDKVKEKLRSLGQSENEYLAGIEKTINNTFIEENLQCSMLSRRKSIYSISNKMESQGTDFHEIYDFFRIKVIYRNDDISEEKFLAWKIYSIITDNYRPNPMRLRDWISSPKSDGYEALHVAVMGPKGQWVEIQIMSERMYEQFKNLDYAHKLFNDSDFPIFLKGLKGAITDPKSYKTTHSIAPVFTSKMVVLSFKGDLRQICKDATALDFAYEIHTDVGNSAKESIINNKAFPLDYTLEPGDIIRINSGQAIEVKEEWLEFVVSSKAKKVLKSIFGKNKREFIFEKKIKEQLLNLEFWEAYQTLLRSDNKRLEEDYEFILQAFISDDEDTNAENNIPKLYKYLIDVWCILNNEEGIISTRKNSELNFELPTKTAISKEANNSIVKEIIKTSESIGEEFENAVISLLDNFFSLDDTFILNQLRKQKRGTQFGFDLQFNCSIKGNKEINCYVECKNIKSKFNLKTIADKLITIEHNELECDYYIFISPHESPTNDLNEIISKFYERTNINVQIWSPDNNIQEFFGIVPDIYNQLKFKPKLNEKHPDKWTNIEKQNVIEKWREKLKPILKLPKGWRDYYLDPCRFLFNHEEQSFRQFEDLYTNHIESYCYDLEGRFFNRKLNDYVDHWLEKPISQSSSLFLLGDFGDGKSVYTYILCRRLSTILKKKPKTGWIPIRFSLKNFSFSGVVDSFTFLERNLKLIGVTVDDWQSLYKNHPDRILLVLDGFDEISKNMDQESVLNNINKLILCFDNEFKNLKVLITSRKHFLFTKGHKSKLLARIGNPKLVHLKPSKKNEVFNFLKEKTTNEEELKKLLVLKASYDPIGLATKPLFMEMLLSTIVDLPKADINEIILYETYINKSLKRKFDLIDHNETQSSQDDIILNFKSLLKDIALKLHFQQEEYVFLDSFVTNYGNNLAFKLWKITTEKNNHEEDAKARIAIRSLLVEYPTIGEERDKMPVDFFHRSIKEYFVAFGLFEMIKNNDKLILIQYLKKIKLNLEIVRFISWMLKENYNIKHEELLLSLIYETRNEKSQLFLKDYANLGCNAINILFQFKGELPGVEWNNLLLDNAYLSGANLDGKNFSNSFLRYANLDNAVLNNSNFSGANLTGVKIEETSFVLSLATQFSNNKVIALYDDLSLKEWDIGDNLTTHSKTILDLPSRKKYNLTSYNSESLIIYNGDRIHLFDKSERGFYNLESIVKFPFKKFIKLLKKNYLFLVDASIEGNEIISLFSINERKNIFTDEYRNNQFDNFEDKAIIKLIQNQSVVVKSIKNIDKKLTVNAEIDAKITTFATTPINNNSFLLGLGLLTGGIEIIMINDLGDTWSFDKIIIDNNHKHEVNNLHFINSHEVVFSSSNKKICRLEFSHEERNIQNREYYFLKLECKNIKIEGLKGEEEYNIIRELMS